MKKYYCDFCGEEMNTGVSTDVAYSLKLPVSNFNGMRGSSIVTHTVEICEGCARNLARYICSEWGYSLD